MFVDNGGALWLSDPTIVLTVLAAVVALIYWCHRWLETGEAPLPRSMAIRIRDRAAHSRTLRERLEARPTLLTSARISRGGLPMARTRRTRRLPLTAA